MVKDTIAQLITTLQNGGLAEKPSVTFQYSARIEKILELLKREGFIKDFSKKGKKIGKSIEVELEYQDGSPRIHKARRVSHFSRRVYSAARDLYPYKNGFGVRVLSTSKGLMTDKVARKARLGGEVLFEIW